MTNNNLTLLPDPFILLQSENGFKPCSSRSWSRDIKKIYANRCFISGLSQNETKIASHHLYSKNSHRLLEYSLLNGVALSVDLHKHFHKKCGMNATPLHLISYIDIYYPQQNQNQCLSNWINFLNQEMLKGYDCF